MFVCEASTNHFRRSPTVSGMTAEGCAAATRDAHSECLTAAGMPHATHPLRRVVIGPLPSKLVSSRTILAEAERQNISLDQFEVHNSALSPILKHFDHESRSSKSPKSHRRTMSPGSPQRRHSSPLVRRPPHFAPRPTSRPHARFDEMQTIPESIESVMSGQDNGAGTSENVEEEQWVDEPALTSPVSMNEVPSEALRGPYPDMLQSKPNYRTKSLFVPRQRSRARSIFSISPSVRRPPTIEPVDSDIDRRMSLAVPDAAATIFASPTNDFSTQVGTPSTTPPGASAQGILTPNVDAIGDGPPSHQTISAASPEPYGVHFSPGDSVIVHSPVHHDRLLHPIQTLEHLVGLGVSPQTGSEASQESDRTTRSPVHHMLHLPFTQDRSQNVSQHDTDSIISSASTRRRQWHRRFTRHPPTLVSPMISRRASRFVSGQRSAQPVESELVLDPSIRNELEARIGITMGHHRYIGASFEVGLTYFSAVMDMEAQNMFLEEQMARPAPILSAPPPPRQRLRSKTITPGNETSGHLSNVPPSNPSTLFRPQRSMQSLQLKPSTHEQLDQRFVPDTPTRRAPAMSVANNLPHSPKRPKVLQRTHSTSALLAPPHEIENRAGWAETQAILEKAQISLAPASQSAEMAKLEREVSQLRPRRPPRSALRSHGLPLVVPTGERIAEVAQRSIKNTPPSSQALYDIPGSFPGEAPVENQGPGEIVAVEPPGQTQARMLLNASLEPRDNDAPRVESVKEGREKVAEQALVVSSFDADAHYPPEPDPAAPDQAALQKLQTGPTEDLPVLSDGQGPISPTGTVLTFDGLRVFPMSGKPRPLALADELEGSIDDWGHVMSPVPDKSQVDKGSVRASDASTNDTTVPMIMLDGSAASARDIKSKIASGGEREPLSRPATPRTVQTASCGSEGFQEPLKASNTRSASEPLLGSSLANKSQRPHFPYDHEEGPMGETIDELDQAQGVRPTTSHVPSRASSTSEVTKELAGLHLDNIPEPSVTPDGHAAETSFAAAHALGIYDFEVENEQRSSADVDPWRPPQLLQPLVHAFGSAELRGSSHSGEESHLLPNLHLFRGPRQSSSTSPAAPQYHHFSAGSNMLQNATQSLASGSSPAHSPTRSNVPSLYSLPAAPESSPGKRLHDSGHRFAMLPPTPSPDVPIASQGTLTRRYSGESLRTIQAQALTSRLIARGEPVRVGAGDKAPAPVREVLARTGSAPLPDDAQRATVERMDDRKLRQALSPVIKRDRMLVKVLMAGRGQILGKFDELESRRYDLRANKWTEYMAVLRPGHLELWNEPTVRGRILGDTNALKLRYDVALVKGVTNLSIYSEIDHLLCLTFPRRIMAVRGKARLSFQRYRTMVLILNLRVATAAADWMWVLWRELGGPLPRHVFVHIPDVSMRVRIPIPSLQSLYADYEQLINDSFTPQMCPAYRGMFARAILDEAARLMQAERNWQALLENMYVLGVQPRLAWRHGTTISWVKYDRTTDGAPRYWSVLAGALMTNHRRMATLELVAGTHYPHEVMHPSGHVLYEPPAVEGFVLRLRPVSGTAVRMYLSEHQGLLFLLRESRSYMPDAHDGLPLVAALEDSRVDRLRTYAGRFRDRERHRTQAQIRYSEGFIDMRELRAIRSLGTDVALSTDLSPTEVRAARTDASALPPSHLQTVYDYDGSRDKLEALLDFPTENDGGMGTEGLNASSDRSHTRALRQFELIFENGRGMTFECMSAGLAREWIVRLYQLAVYWSCRRKADARSIMTASARHSATDVRDAQGRRIDELIAQSLRYNWNWCRIEGCRPIRYSGRLFWRTHMRHPFQSHFFALCHGQLLSFRMMSSVRTASSRQNEGIFYRRVAQPIRLRDAYVYTGHVSDQLADQKEGRTNKHGSHDARRTRGDMPRLFNDGLYTFDSTEECAFVLRVHTRYDPLAARQTAFRLRRPHASDHSDGDLIPGLAESSHSEYMFYARTAVERDLWVRAIMSEIELLARNEPDREARVRAQGKVE